MKRIQKLSLLLWMSLLFFSCSSEDTSPTTYVPQGDFDSGVLILNEGSFGTPNASVSYLSFDLNRLQNEIYAGVNSGAILGDTAQSIGFNGNLAYIVVNKSAKIVIVNRYTMLRVGEITTGLFSPRYIAFANGKGYVTDWGTGAGAGTVKVINLGTNSVEQTITVADYPNHIEAYQGKIYVAHNDLGSLGNSVSVINAATNVQVQTFNTSALPNSMRFNGNFMWVSCNGVTSYPVPENESAGRIQKIDLTSGTVVLTLTQPGNTRHVSFMDIYGSNLYYVVGNEIFKMPLANNAMPLLPAFTVSAQYIYAFAVKSNRIYVGDARGFDTAGEVKVYSSGEIFDPNPVGTLLKSVEVGLAPNGFYFNQ